jgi:uncharacterized protein (TIGR02996 family)
MPRQRRPWLIALTALALLSPAPAARGAPHVPTDPDVVLERVPRTGDPRVADLAARLAADPSDLATAVALAERYAALDRATQDSRYAGYAQAALAPWWHQAEPPPRVLILRGLLRQHRHDFAGALADLDRAAAVTPGAPQVWLVRAAVLQVLGRPADALASCRRLRGLALPVVGAVCEAGAAARMGQAVVALIVLEGAIGDGAEVPRELRAWAWTALAETTAALAQPADAERAFRAAVTADPGDAYTVNAYADFLLDQGRPAEVQALVGDDLRNDGKLLRLALAEQALGDPGYPARADELRSRFAAARLRGDAVGQREEARFLLAADPQAALQLALANWAIQREPWDARVLLEAARAAGLPQAAAPVVTWIAATGIEDVTLRALAARVAGAGS